MDLLDLEVRFQQALHYAELECTAKGLGWRDFSLLAPHRQAFQFRIEQITTRKGVKVNRRAALEKRLKNLSFLRPLPKLSYGPPWFEIFRKADIVCAVSEVRGNHTSIGKEFTLQIALLRQEDDKLQAICSDNLFRVVGSAWEKPSWFYHDEAELGYCLDEMEAMLHRLIPILKLSLETQFNQSCDSLLRELGDISARQAFSAACEFLAVSHSDILLNALIAFPRLSIYSLDDLTKDGRLLTNGMWRLMGWDRTMERTAIVDVPFRGPIRGGWQQTMWLGTPIAEWMDSPDAASVFCEDLRVQSFRARTFKLEGHAPAYWAASIGSTISRIHCVNGKRVMR